MRLAEKKLFSRDENDNSDLVQSSPKGKFVPFEKKNTYIGIKTVEDMNNMKENFLFSLKITLLVIWYNHPYNMGSYNLAAYNMDHTRKKSKFYKPVKILEEANNGDGKIWGRLTEDLENDIEILKEDFEFTDA